MPKNVSSLSIGLFGDVSHFAKSFGNTAINSVKSFGSSIVGAGSTLLKFTGIAAVVSTAFEAIQHLGDGFKLAATLEKTQVQFAALIGDSTKAKQAISDLTQFAHNTPFELPALIDTSRQLLAFGVSNDKLLPSLKAIGDVAAGVGQPLEEVTAIFGRVAEEGVLSERSLRQFAKAGIPVVDELAKQFGVNKTQIAGMAQAGQIGFKDLQQAFASMTGPAGKFHDQMEKQAGSLGGLFTRLSGAVEAALGDVAESLLKAFDLKGGIKFLTSGLATAASAVSNFIAYIGPTVNRIGSSIASGFMVAYHYVAPIVANIAAVVVRTFGMISAAVVPILSDFWGVVQTVWGAIYDFIAPIVTGMYQAVVANWQTIIQTITTASYAIYAIVSAAWGMIADAAASIWNGIVSVWQWGSELITGHSVTAGQAVTSAWDGIGSAAKWLSDTISLAFNVAAFAIKHFDDGVAIVALEVAGFFTDLADRAAYVFGQAIPYGLGYLSRNWKQIFIDLGEFQLTVMENMGHNVVAIFKKLPGLIAGTTNWSDVWQPLTQGFKSQIKETFQIPEFANSQLTNSLKKQASDLETAYGQGLGSYLTSQETKAKATAQKAGDWIKTALGIGGEKPVVPKIEAPPAVPVKAIASLTPDALALNIVPEIKRAKAIRVGSAEAQLARLAIPGLRIGQAGQPGGIAAPQAGAAPRSPQAAQSQGMQESANAILKEHLQTAKVVLYYTRQIWQQGQNVQVVSL